MSVAVTVGADGTVTPVEQTDLADRSLMEDETPGGTATPQYYMQKYKKEWEELPGISEWLRPVPDDEFSALCIYCNTKLRCHKRKLYQHELSRKHQNNLQRGGVETREGGKLPPAKEFRSRVPLGKRFSSADAERAASTPNRRRPGRAKPPLVTLRKRSLRSAPAAAEPDETSEQEHAVSYTDKERVTFSIGLGGNSVGFIGAGTIAQAVAKSILDKGLLQPDLITVSSPTDTHRRVWRGWGCHTTHSNDTVLNSCDLIFLAVPATSALHVLSTLTPVTEQKERCFVSLVPGLGRDTLQRHLDSKLQISPADKDEDDITMPFHIIRCMTNLAVRNGTGCCAYSCPEDLPHRWLLCFEVVCGALGSTHCLPDHHLDAFAAAFTAGAAYSVAFCEALALGAVSAGLPWDLAKKMAAQTLLGTGHLLLEDSRVGILREQTAPPGGATIAGLLALQEGHMRAGVVNAVQASMKSMRESSQ